MPGNENDQTYNAPVGSVLTADTMVIGVGGSGDKVPDKAVVAPTLIDRGPQINPVIDRLRAMLAKGGGTLLVVVPAEKEDLPQALVVRCGLVDFVTHFGGIGKWRYLQRLEWPEGAESVDRILFDIGTILGDLPEGYGRPEVEGRIRSLGRHLCFAHFVDARTWDEDDDGALVRKWVDHVNTGELAAGEGRLIVAFLCLVRSTGRPGDADGIGRFVDTLRGKPAEAADAGERVFVTKPLGLIRDTHVDDWGAKVSRYLDAPAIEAELLNVAKKLFTPRKQEQRLGVIWDKLCEVVTAAVKRSACFKEGT